MERRPINNQLEELSVKGELSKAFNPKFLLHNFTTSPPASPKELLEALPYIGMTGAGFIGLDRGFIKLNDALDLWDGRIYTLELFVSFAIPYALAMTARTLVHKHLQKPE